MGEKLSLPRLLALKGKTCCAVLCFKEVQEVGGAREDCSED